MPLHNIMGENLHHINSAPFSFTSEVTLIFLLCSSGKDAKRGILLDEECQLDIESAFYRETVAKKYASLFHSTLHHNTGYFLQVKFSFSKKATKFETIST
jgi:hypothetical protein